MKVRTGFVSNSSSSSFCIVGVVVDSDELLMNKELFNVAHDWPEEYETSAWDVLHELFKRTDSGLYYHRGIDEVCSDDFVVGLSIEQMDENETLKSFKKRIYAELEKVFPNKYQYHDVSIIVDGGRDY